MKKDASLDHLKPSMRILAEKRRKKKSPDRIDVLILTELKKYPPSTMRQIADVAKRKHTTIAQRYRWLKENGYIKRAPNAPAGSARSLILTEKGFEYLSNVKNF